MLTTRPYRRLAADNTRVFNFQFDNDGTFLPFTIIGSDGGYLPAPQVVDEVTLGITERADVLVDFSSFAPGTQIILRNTTPGITEDTTGILMRFTVVNSAAVAPPPLSPSLFPARPDPVPQRAGADQDADPLPRRRRDQPPALDRRPAVRPSDHGVPAGGLHRGVGPGPHG